MHLSPKQMGWVPVCGPSGGVRQVAGLCDDGRVTLVIAHRGASRAEPENTIAAFERAVAIGADGVELDVRRTVDDRLVVLHDARVPDGRAVRDVPRAELPDAVPTLGEALDACSGAFVNIELKNIAGEPDADPTHWLAARVGAWLQRRGGGPRWLLSSFSLDTVDRCRRVAPACRTAWLTEELTPAVIELAAARGHDAVHPWERHVDQAGIRDAHRAGLAVNVWTCNDPERLATLMAWGVDGVCTDVPDVALAVRRGDHRA